MSEIRHGDSLHELKNIESNTIDAVITDPPYGYSFMGKDWDKAVPSVEIWQECLRVLKPGGWCLVMSAPRSDVQNAMISRLMEAGFRLDFTPIYWTYASGFPKAGNVGKLVDKRLGVEREITGTQKLQGTARRMKGGNFGDFGGEDTADVVNLSKATSPQAKALDGSYTGFQPKPAVEVVIVAMKPLSEKTYVDQALTSRKGITWLDDCRVPTDEARPLIIGQPKNGNFAGVFREGSSSGGTTTEGRFPANLLVSDQSLNTHSKFFDLDAWADTLPFLAVPKASKSEKDKGLDHLEEQRIVSMATANGTSGKPSSITAGRNTTRRNTHPTVKPLKLMSYLITLTTREGDTVLDPFVGSGTTAVAAEVLGRIGIGIERDAEYVEIAQARLAHHKETMAVQPRQTSMLDA